MTGYEIFKRYNAIKLHFNSDTYDFSKYNGKTRVKYSTYEKRPDKHFFKKLAKRPTQEADDFLVANFLHNSDVWIGNILSNDAEDIYWQWRKDREASVYIFKEDLKKLLNYCEKESIVFRQLLEVPKDEHPRLLTLYLQKEISVETMVFLCLSLKLFRKWREISEVFVWPKESKRLKKYIKLRKPMAVEERAEILRKVLNG